MKLKRAGFAGIFMVVMILLQIMTTYPSFAEGEPLPDDLTGTKYLNIHKTSGEYSSTGGVSSVKVAKDGTEILPETDGDRLTYNDIPAGASIELRCVFNLEDGDQEAGDLYSYGDNHYFTMTMPEGIRFEAPSEENNKLMATDQTTNETWQMGTWSITDNVIRISFSDQLSEHSGMWGELVLNGEIDLLTDENENSSDLLLGSQTVVFNREEPKAPEIVLEKSGIYDFGTHSILWTVTAKGELSGGLQLLDTYGDNQSYLAGSFTLAEEAVADTDISVDEENHQILYSLPDDVSDPATITYRTVPTSYSGENGISVFENKAVIISAENETLTEEVNA